MGRIQMVYNIDGLAQNYSIPSALAVEMLQSCTKPSISNEKEVLIEVIVSI